MGNKLQLGKASFSIRDKQLHMVLTDNQIQLVKRFWNLLKGDLETLGGIVFRRFFEIEPQLKILFPQIVHINHENKLDANIDMDMLIRLRYGVVVMNAVESLGDSSNLNCVIISIGQIHCYRNVKPKTIKKLWPCLKYGLQQVLKENYTKSVSQAWKCVYCYVCGLMIHGMLNQDSDKTICWHTNTIDMYIMLLPVFRC